MLIQFYLINKNGKIMIYPVTPEWPIRTETSLHILHGSKVQIKEIIREIMILMDTLDTTDTQIQIREW